MKEWIVGNLVIYTVVIFAIGGSAAGLLLDVLWVRPAEGRMLQAQAEKRALERELKAAAGNWRGLAQDHYSRIRGDEPTEDA